MTECLITRDGSEDHIISPEGLSGYKVPRVLLEASSSAIQRPRAPSDIAERNEFAVFDDFQGEEE